MKRPAKAKDVWLIVWADGGVAIAVFDTREQARRWMAGEGREEHSILRYTPAPAKKGRG